MKFTNHRYQLTHDRKHNAIRKFVLGRMRDLKPTEVRFTVPKQFDPKRFFNHSRGVMTGTGDYKVVIELDARLMDSLLRRKWHP